MRTSPFALDCIATVELGRSRRHDGWGSHWTTRGMLHDASGFDVVLVDGRTTMPGADDVARRATTG